MTAPARCPLLSGAFSAAFAACSERSLGLIGVALHACWLGAFAPLWRPLGALLEPAAASRLLAFFASLLKKPRRLSVTLSLARVCRFLRRVLSFRMMSPRALLLIAVLRSALGASPASEKNGSRAPSPVFASILRTAVNLGSELLRFKRRFLAQSCSLSGTAGLQVYGRFARDFDYDLYRLAAAKASPETSASLPVRPHCDVGSTAPLVIDAVAGDRTALFPGGITQRSAPDFAAVVSKLAASSSPGQVAASALHAQALQTGMVRWRFRLWLLCMSCDCIPSAPGTCEDHGFCSRTRCAAIGPAAGLVEHALALCASGVRAPFLSAAVLCKARGLASWGVLCRVTTATAPSCTRSPWPTFWSQI